MGKLSPYFLFLQHSFCVDPLMSRCRSDPHHRLTLDQSLEVWKHLNISFPFVSLQALHVWWSDDKAAETVQLSRCEPLHSEKHFISHPLFWQVLRSSLWVFRFWTLNSSIIYSNNVWTPGCTVVKVIRESHDVTRPRGSFSQWAQCGKGFDWTTGSSGSRSSQSAVLCFTQKPTHPEVFDAVASFPRVSDCWSAGGFLWNLPPPHHSSLFPKTQRSFRQQRVILSVCRRRGRLGASRGHVSPAGGSSWDPCMCLFILFYDVQKQTSDQWNVILDT